MKRGWKAAAFAVVGSLALSLSGAAWYGLSAPPLHPLPLAHNLIDATSAEGKQLLTTSLAKSDYEQLSPYFVPQIRRAFCGIASSAIVVNAVLHQQPVVTQETFFTPPVSAVRSELEVSFGGLTLEQLAKVIEVRGLHVQVVHAAQSNLESFRTMARITLAEPFAFLIVNYDRVTLGQEGSGHISPLAAYNADTDRVLVLDVAAQKYPYTWVPVPELWKAMNTVDSTSGQTRGFVLVKAGEVWPSDIKDRKLRFNVQRKYNSHPLNNVLTVAIIEFKD